MLIKNIDEFERNGQKGDWCFLNNFSYIVIQYGEESFKNRIILPISENPINKGQWTWNGSKETPTLIPSILVKKCPGWTDRWHGYLTNGELIPC